MTKKDQETRTEGAGTQQKPETVTEAPRPHGHLELVGVDKPEVGAVEMPTVVAPSSGAAAMSINGQPLPPGTRIEKTADGQATIHLPEHCALPRMKDRVAIVGFTPSKALAPYNDQDFEFWGLNALYVHEGEIPIGRFTRWFDVHDMTAVNAERVGKYRTLPCPVYLQDVVAGMPNSVKFPKAEIEAQFGSGYFTNSISWMIGMALMMGYKTIAVYGVDMAQDCLAPDANLLTADLRWVRADEVQEGDKLMGFDETPGDGTGAVHARRIAQEGGGVATATEVRAARTWRVSEVLGRSVASRPSYRIHFEDGTSVVASEGHRWLTIDGGATAWKHTDELVPGVTNIVGATNPVLTEPVDYANTVGVVGVEFLGETETVGFTTTTQTLVVEGLASHNSEYRFQRPNVEYWLGIAKGMGREIIVAETSDLLKASHQYGFGTDHGFRAKLKERMTEFNNREVAIDAEIQRLTLAKATVNGAKQNVEWTLQSWTVADHTSMTPDLAKVAPEAAAAGGGKVA